MTTRGASELIPLGALFTAVAWPHTRTLGRLVGMWTFVYIDHTCTRRCGGTVHSFLFQGRANDRQLAVPPWLLRQCVPGEMLRGGRHAHRRQYTHVDERERGLGPVQGRHFSRNVQLAKPTADRQLAVPPWAFGC